MTAKVIDVNLTKGRERMTREVHHKNQEFIDAAVQ
jgi:hypothetical protein